ncbi:MAG: 3-hydroxybutyrate dehydrogenase [Rhodobacterales bacterium]|nr:3-hydroxybutyrate dehydrogenase [Rhodobacterales bacterium]
MADRAPLHGTTPPAGDLSGKCALVTGSTSGIGLGIARALAGAGADVMLSGFGDPRAIETLRADMEDRAGVRVRHDPADLSVPAEIERLMADTAATLGPPDILVNNAGLQHVAPLDAFPPDTWDRIIAINRTAALRATRLALPAMRRRAWGRVVNVVSTHGLVASPGKSAYIAAKHGLAGLTKAAALEAAADGITANGICPGYVRTDLIERQIADLAAQRGEAAEAVAVDMLAEKHPSGRFVEIEQVAALALFLCSDAAASITGTLLPVDGGWTAR